MKKELEILVDFYKKQHRMMTKKEYNEIAVKMNLLNSELLKNELKKNWHELREDVRTLSK